MPDDPIALAEARAEVARLWEIWRYKQGQDITDLFRRQAADGVDRRHEATDRIGHVLRIGTNIKTGNSRPDDGGWRVDFGSFSPAAELEWRGYATVQAVSILRRNNMI